LKTIEASLLCISLSIENINFKQYQDEPLNSSFGFLKCINILNSINQVIANKLMIQILPSLCQTLKSLLQSNNLSSLVNKNIDVKEIFSEMLKYINRADDVS
jgi:hypothetical protein